MSALTGDLDARLRLADSTLHDARYALRALRRQPLFTLTAVLTLALTIAAVATLFTITNTILWRPLPADHPEQLVTVSATRREGRILAPVSYPDYLRLRDGMRTVSALAAHYSTAPLFVTTGGRAEEVNGAVVSANFFPALGVTPEAGRFFRKDEDQVPDRDRVAVISRHLWETWLGSSAGAVGSTLKINGVAFTVIGVVPEAFRGAAVNPSEIYIPTMMLRVGYRWCEDALAASCTTLDMIGRLAPGRTVESARAEATVMTPTGWLHARDGDNTGLTASAARGTKGSDDEMRVVQLLAALSGVLLLVCSLNLAGLFTARTSLRGRELAIRTALGASRHRLIRQLMTESLIVSLLGGARIALSLVTTHVLDALFFARDSEGHPLHFDFTLDPSVVLAIVVVVVGVAFGFGLAPAVKWSRISAVETLKRNGSGASPRARPGYWLVGAQAALAVALLSVAGLLLAGAHRLASGMNYEASHVALMRLRPRLVQYMPEKAQTFQRSVLRALGETPGVQSISLVGTGAVLFGGDARVWRPDWTDPARQALEVGYIDVGARYFATLETPVIGGREFDDRDSVSALPVAIVNEALARRLWPKGQVLGAPLVVEGHERHVVGIVSDVPLQARGDPVKPYVYVPYWQNLDQVDARYCIRVAGSPDAILPRLARAVHRVDPDVPIAEMITLPVQLEGMFTPVRVSAVLLSYAAGLTMVLCAVGLYAAVAYSLSRRTREIGIRSAVGATRWQVLSLVVRQGMTVVLAGTVVGYFVALGAAGSVQHLLYGLQDRDWVFYAGAMVLVAAIGLVACWLPARRAAVMDPMAALRDS